MTKTKNQFLGMTESEAFELLEARRNYAFSICTDGRGLRPQTANKLRELFHTRNYKGYRKIAKGKKAQACIELEKSEKDFYILFP